MDATTNGSIPNARITQVISNRKAAFGLQRAQQAGIPTAVLSLKTWLNAHPGSARSDYDAALANAVLAGGAGQAATPHTQHDQLPHLVVLAGFMHIVSPAFLQPLEQAKVPVINLHPALPGAFDGIDAIPRAWQAFQQGQLKDNCTGVMVHNVVEQVDRGAPIIVRQVECRKGESLEDLTERMHLVEHQIIVEATKKMLESAS